MKNLSKRIFLFCSMICFCIQIQAQNTNKGNADIAFAAGKGIFSTGLSYYRLHPVALKKKFSIGYGVRFTSYFGVEGNYITAPASVSEGNFFKPQNKLKLDTLVLDNGQVNSINAAIYLVYNINSRLIAGFNIDVIGGSFGKKQTGTFKSYEQGFAKSIETGKVANFNLLLTGDYDLGNLNSEVYLMYFLNEKIAVRGGLSFLFSEYITDRKLAFDNDRFRRKTLSGLVALTYRF
jgi:hypothetical protein